MKLSPTAQHLTFALFAAVFAAPAATAQPAPPHPPDTISWVPITFRQDSGTRPFIPVLMNAKPFLMMVHANARFYVQTTHENAAAIGLTNLGKQSDYGITHDGHVSPLGRTSATLHSLKIGDAQATDVPLAVFEIPQNPVTNGMLGTAWLRDQRVLVDYDSARLGIPASTAASHAEDQRLIHRGYIPHKITWDPDNNTWFILATIDGHSIRLCVSTVAENVIDIEWAKANHIPLGPVIDQQGGPAGALVPEYIVKYVAAYTIDGQSVAPSQPVSWDLFAYSSQPRTQSASASKSAPMPPGIPPYNQGYLGADFMLANQAIIAFGTETLFLPK